MMNFEFTPLIGLGWIGMFLWWALVIAGIAMLLKWLAGEPRGPFRRTQSPLEILRERYARGEIDKAEFEEKKRELIR